MEYHPDKNQDKDMYNDSAFKRIRSAYDVLSKPESKWKYDQQVKLKEEEVKLEKKETMIDPKDVVFDQSTEDAFAQLIRGKYPD